MQLKFKRENRAVIEIEGKHEENRGSLVWEHFQLRHNKAHSKYCSVGGNGFALCLKASQLCCLTSDVDLVC